MACLVAVIAPGIVAGADGQALTVPEALSNVRDLQTQLEDAALSKETAHEARTQLPRFLKLARECTDKRQQRLDSAREQLDTLGEPLASETAALKTARQEIHALIQKQQQALANCKLLMLESEALIDALDSHDNARRTAELTIRYPNIFSLLGEWRSPGEWLDSILHIEFPQLGLKYLDTQSLSLLTGLTILLLTAGLYTKKTVLPRLKPSPPDATLATQIIKAFRSSGLRYLPSLLVFMGWMLFWVIIARDARPWPELAVVSFALFGFVLALHISRSFFSPPPPARHYLPVEEALSRRFWGALRYLLIMTAISIAIFKSPFYTGLTEPILILTRALIGTLFTGCLVWVIWLAFTLNSIRGIDLFRPLITVALVVGLVAEWLGYRNLSNYVIGGIFYSMLSLGLAWIASRVTSDFLDGLDEGHYRWERRLRYRLGLTDNQALPGLLWLRILAAIAIWGGLTWILLDLWGLSARGQAALIRYFDEGFSLGPVTIVPSQLVLAVVFFSVLLSLVAWLKKQLDQRWLGKARIDRGAREAAVTVSGYVGIGLALLIALAVAGVDFKNLAIIAGALSVGIGFGLQNIVNNFVSGLILLFERPIRTGDWIIVGQTQGYVKSINIRSTQITTFDRSDVFVPNSDLISGQVTNWMLRDMSGRVCVPAEVAYGSDTARVKEVLLQCAREHPAPVKNASLPEPHVLFMGFGENSLRFELRFFIRQIDELLNVRSDMNFAIDAAFRQAGLEIPFPRRDLRIRQWPANSGDAGVPDRP